MKRFGDAPKPCVIPLFPLFRIVRIHHHPVSPNNPHIEGLFCLSCTPPFHRIQDISLFSSFTIGFGVLKKTVSLETRRLLPHEKKLARVFFKKTQKVFARISRKNFHVWYGVCLYDNPAFQKGNYFVIFILIQATNRTQINVSKRHPTGTIRYFNPQIIIQ